MSLYYQKSNFVIRKKPKKPIKKQETLNLNAMFAVWYSIQGVSYSNISRKLDML